MQVQDNESFIKYTPQLGKELGRGEMVFLNKLIFNLNNPSLGKQHEGRKWIFKTRDQWGEEIGYSRRQIARIIHKLQSNGLIFVKKLRQVYGNSTNYYAINEEELLKLLSLHQNADKSENDIKKVESQNGIPSGQCGTLSTKNTNKEINNKSEEKNNQVTQVKNLNLEVNTEQQDTSNSSTSSPSTKPSTVQDMLAYWNKNFVNSKTTMSKQIAPLLLAAFKHKFNSNMRKWEQYCKIIASSPYLTSEKFKLSLLWALKYSTIDRILNGEFGVKEVPLMDYSREDALSHVASVHEPERCKEVRRLLLDALGEQTYRNWLEQVDLFIEEDSVCFKGKNKFIQDYIQQHIWKYARLEQGSMFGVKH